MAMGDAEHPYTYYLDETPFIDAITYNPYNKTLSILVRTRREGSSSRGFLGWNHHTIIYNLESGNWSDFMYRDWVDDIDDSDQPSHKLLSWKNYVENCTPPSTHPELIDNTNDLPEEQITDPNDMYYLKHPLFRKAKLWKLTKSPQEQAAFVCWTNKRKIYRLPNQHRATIIAWGPREKLVTAFKDLDWLEASDPQKFTKGDDCTGAYLWDSGFIDGQHLTQDQLKLPRIFADQSTELRKNNPHANCSLADCAQGAHITTATLARVLRTFPAQIKDKLIMLYKISTTRQIPNKDDTPTED